MMINLTNHKDGTYSIESDDQVIVVSAGELLDLELEIWRAMDKAIGERPSLYLRMKRLRAARGLTE